LVGFAEGGEDLGFAPEGEEEDGEDAPDDPVEGCADDLADAEAGVEARGCVSAGVVLLEHEVRGGGDYPGDLKNKEECCPAEGHA